MFLVLELKTGTQKLIAKKVDEIFLVDLIKHYNDTHEDTKLKIISELPTYLKDKRIKQKFKLDIQEVNGIKFRGMYSSALTKFENNEVVTHKDFGTMVKLTQFTRLLENAKIKYNVRGLMRNIQITKM